MLYTYTITVPKSTAKTSPVDTITKLTLGVITRVSFRPRPGHAGLCHCQVLQRNTVLWPVNPDDSLHGDTFPIEWDEHHEMTEAPYELTIRAWNLDDTYAHTFDISFAITELQFTLGAILSKALGDILRILSPRRIFGGGS